MNNSAIISKDNFEQLFEILKGLGKVYAPVRVSDQSFSFKHVNSAGQIAFEALRTILPPKKFFYPGQETIITFQGTEVSEHAPELEFTVLFGVHPCDLAGLAVLDTIFSADPADTHYQRRRKACLIVGLSCLPDKFCFCQSMGTDCPTAGYDLFLTDIGDAFFIMAATSAGAEVLQSAKDFLSDADEEHRSRYKEFWNLRSKAFTNGFAPDNLHSVMDMEWNNKLWQDLGERCLSCGNCTPVCPTCYCFDLVDIASLNGTDGERRREWDSCQFSGFALIAGDHNFRPTPVDRLKFWYRHKLHGFDDPYGFKTCVGCGRCTVSCPSGIDDIVNVVRTLQQNGNTENEQAR